MSTHAVIATGGKQYLVEPGKTYAFEKILGAVGDPVTFDQVLLTFAPQGADVRIGTPTVAGASVRGIIVHQGRERKVTVVKYRAKSRYRRMQGHRQHYTAVRIDAIG